MYKLDYDVRDIIKSVMDLMKREDLSDGMKQSLIRSDVDKILESDLTDIYEMGYDDGFEAANSED